MRSVPALLCVLFVSCATVAPPPAPQTSEVRTLAERLGHPADAKLLIIHADDLGMSHSVNAASIQALESGAVNSASIMVPCPWFSEIAEYARTHPQADLGLHLTLTSEWTHYRWGPVLSKSVVPTLLDAHGYLHKTEDVAAAKIDVRQAEAEVRAQIERAKAFGIDPTHLDSHMRTLHQTPELLDVLLRVSREYGLPPSITVAFRDDPRLAGVIRPDDLLIDRSITIGNDIPPDRWPEFYESAIRSLQPGVTELVVHVAYDDAEMKAATFDHPAWGSAWRQRELDYLSSDRFRTLLREHGVQLVTWRDLRRLMR